MPACAAEISVFGAGFGESIVAKIDDHRWVVIDSLLDETGSSVSLQYLRSQGVDVKQDVAAILITHWHDDHIAGAGQLVSECSSAVIGIPATLQTKTFKEFLKTHNKLQDNTFGTGVSELMGIVQLVKRDKRVRVWCMSNRILLEDRNVPLRFEALSPSDDDFEVFLRDLGRLPTDGPRVQRPNENYSSVVSVVEAWDDIWLFGADLENQRFGGWPVLIDRAWLGRGPASFLKIAHHGSANGDHERVWNELLTDDPIAVLTSWNRGSKLPTPPDVERIMGNTSRAYAASKPIPFRARKRVSTVERELASMGITLWRDLSEVGQVRARRGPKGNWEVELLGPGAVELGKVLA